MARYNRDEAREWARENLVGVINCTIPSFTGDLRTINENAIRHDTRLAIEHGFTGTLGVSESSHHPSRVPGLPPPHQGRGGRAADVLPPLELERSGARALEASSGAEDTGAEVVLLSYPAQLLSAERAGHLRLHRAICDSTTLGVMIFPMFLWGFSPRIHAFDIPAPLIRRLLDDCPNIVAIKAEGGFPGIMGVIECHRRFGEEVVISCPIDSEFIPLAQVMPLRLSATSDHEYFGSDPDRLQAQLQPGEIRRGHGAVLEDPPGAQGQERPGGAAQRRSLHQPPGMEVPGLVAGLQRRPAAAADATHP